MTRHRRRHLLLIGVALSAVALSGCFGPGLHPVGNPLTSTQMPPGLWRSLGGSGCQWSRIQNGAPAIAGKSTHDNGPQYAQIAASDIGFASSNCLPFWQHPGPFARPLAQPGSPFGDGDFLVGSEVAPGTYVASPPAGQVCNWAVVRGFHGKDSSGRNPDFVRGDTTSASAPTAVVDLGDFGFTSQGCGQWRASTPLPAAPGGASASPVQIGGKVEDFPDPFVLPVDDAVTCGGTAPCYYAYSTESGFLGLVNVPVARSSDLTTWTWAGPVVTGTDTSADGTPSHDAMPVLASWVQFGGNWAPSVLPRLSNLAADERYVMYYTAKSRDSSPYGGKECVGIATSASPGGPFVDHAAAPVLCNVAAGGTIDASPFVASDGTLSLTYADDVGIKAQRLRSDGLALAGGEQLLVHFDSGYAWELPRVEGPSMFSTPETGIVLLYSAGTFSNPTYSVGAAQCDTPLGPCRHIYSTPSLSSRGRMYGPGGQTPFALPDGSWWLAFHAWADVVGYGAGGIRSLTFLPLTFPSGKPAVG